MHTPAVKALDPVVVESALRILRDHSQDGDRFVRLQTARLIAVDQPLITLDPIVAGLTAAQRQQRALMLDAMRAGQLRPLPTCFGELS
jgi:hypothetical protein